jgi:hypothetical protein
MHSRREATMLVGIAIDREVEEVGADATIVEQRIALARRSISANRLAVLFALDKEGKQFALSFVDLGSEFRVRDDIGSPIFCSWSSNLATAGVAPCLASSRVRLDAKGTTVCGQLFDIENSETMAPRKLIDRNQ